MSCGREQGSASLIVICAMLGVLFMALALHAVVKHGAEGSEELLLETRLRLAAESRVEMVAREIEKSPAEVISLPKSKWQDYGAASLEQGIRVTVKLKHGSNQPEGEEDIFLKAWAEPEDKAAWSKGKIVCGYLHRRGNECDWRGWRGVED